MRGKRKNTHRHYLRVCITAYSLHLALNEFTATCDHAQSHLHAVFPAPLLLVLNPPHQAFESCLDKVESALASSQGPWLIDMPNNGPSLVDLQYISHVERMVASVLYWRGLNLRNHPRYPNLEAW